MGQHVPRLLINREKAGELTAVKRSLGYTRGFDWDPATNYRCGLGWGCWGWAPPVCLARVVWRVGQEPCRQLPVRLGWWCGRVSWPVCWASVVCWVGQEFGLAAHPLLPACYDTHPQPCPCPFAEHRDALFLGDCDDGVRQLCQQLGWEDELDALIAAGRAQFEQARADSAAADGGEAAAAAAAAAAACSSTEAVLRATAEAAAGDAAAAPEPAGEAAAEARPETVAAKVAAQAAL